MSDEKHKKTAHQKHHDAPEDRREAAQESPEEVEYSEDRDGKGGPVTETLKKLFTVGVSAAFMTEESIRNYLGDLKLPKELMQLVLQTAGRGKEEMMNRISKEISTIIQKTDMASEVAKFLENHRIRVSAEIEILPPKDKDEKKE